MNPTEVYEFLTKLIRESPEIAVALAMGMVGMWVFLWQFKFIGGHKECLKRASELESQRIAEYEKRLTVENQLADAQRRLYHAELEAKHEREMRELAEATRDEYKLKVAEAEKERAEKEKLAARYLSDFKRVSARLEPVQKAYDELTIVCNQTREERDAAQVEASAAKTELVGLRGSVSRLEGENRQLVADWTAARDRLQVLGNDNAIARETVTSLRRQVAQMDRHLAARDRRIADLEEGANDLEKRVGDLQSENDQLKGIVEEQTRERVKYSTLYGKKCKQLRSVKNHLEKVVTQGGRTWERPVAPDATPFVPLADRGCPIISLLNLKGGVGKTTLALNIAATLAGQGKRVLLVDLDYQRSLSHLCVLAAKRRQLHRDRRALQHYLLAPEADRTPEAFLACVAPVNGIERCSIVINSDPFDSREKPEEPRRALADAEETLLLDWVTRVEAQSDVRLYLREALHSRLIAGTFDYVFLDCPPRLSTATINAIAASDFVLIPVGLDAAAATNPIPHLFRELRRLRAPGRFPQLSLLGVIANRVQMHGNTMLGEQGAVWRDVGQIGETHWEEKVHLFRTPIKNAICFTKASRVLVEESDSAAVIHEDATIKVIFKDVVTELQERIAHESKHLAAVRP